MLGVCSPSSTPEKSTRDEMAAAQSKTIRPAVWSPGPKVSVPKKIISTGPKNPANVHIVEVCDYFFNCNFRYSVWYLRHT